AGVPSPGRQKRANESTSPGKPATINSIPTARVACRSKNGGRNSQRVIHHGMSPASTLGAATKKRAEPRMAIVIVRLHARELGAAAPARPTRMALRLAPSLPASYCRGGPCAGPPWLRLHSQGHSRHFHGQQGFAECPLCLQ